MLSVVIPVLNEAPNLRDLLQEIRQALDAVMPFEIILVDDASTDNTDALLPQLFDEFPQLRVLRHDRRSGQSAGLRTGIRAARYEWIATLDGDGQNDPADLPKLWAARPTEAAPCWMAIGHRLDRRDTGAKRFASKFANGLRRRALRDDTPDTGCGIKIFPRELFLQLPWFNHIHRFLPALVRRAGGTSISIPVGHRERTRGQSKYGVWDRAWVGIWDLMGVMWLLRRNAVPHVEELHAAQQSPPMVPHAAD
ncbi:MAG: glycosyltransferase family 2 protein [Planctomycetes bacterium]|nr:glycosyltransferase family 2 protein [Planctomycetota bacterium]